MSIVVNVEIDWGKEIIKEIYSILQKHVEITKKEYGCEEFTFSIDVNNPNIIRALKSEIPSLGADCSSPGELYAAKLGGISSNDCIFTGNYESQEDLEIAFKQKAHINLDDITSFRRLKKMGTPKEISFRLILLLPSWVI